MPVTAYKEFQQEIGENGLPVQHSKDPVGQQVDTWLREAKPSRVLDVVRTETPINAEGGETRSMLVTVGVLYEE